MSVKELIEDIVIKELISLCTSCARYGDCSYRRESERVVIQCELYEADEESTGGSGYLQQNAKGLCRNCSNYQVCNFSEKKVGVWHCEEYD